MSAFKNTFCFKDISLILIFISIFFITLNYHSYILHQLTSFSSAFATVTTTTKISPTTTTTTVNHLVFSIASSSKTFSKRKEFIRLWHKPNFTKTYVFLDHPLSENYKSPKNTNLPSILIYENMSRFPYTHRAGARYALGLTYMIKQVIARNDSNVRWYIFGDDDTIFFVDNLVKMLGKYDHNEWYYIGSNSESYVQNNYFSFDMAFGGGGYAISQPLAMVLARVLDSCLMRYPSLYGSDARIFSCLAELGVSLTHEPGFHQDDLWGNLFGLLSSHPLSPLLSLHHIEDVQSIFPNMTKIQALQHLFKAANVDPARISQQTICYDRENSLSIAVAWGYAIQVYEGNIKVPELITVLRSFDSWDKDKRRPYFMFKTKVESRGPCKKMVAFLDSVDSNGDKVWTNYTRHRVVGKTCTKDGNKVIKNLEEIRVHSSKLDTYTRQVRAPRRHCCDISLSSQNSMDIHIRPYLYSNSRNGNKKQREPKTEICSQYSSISIVTIITIIIFSMFSSSNTVEMPMVPRFIHTQNRLKDLLLIFSTLVIFYLIFLLHHIQTPKTSFNPNPNFSKTLSTSTNLSISHLFFSIAASSSSFSNRLSYINLWYKPNSTNAVVFLDDPISISTLSVSSPPILVSSDTSKFPYSFPAGRRSAIRIARIVKDTFDLVKNVNFNDTRWFVFGDDDTVFFTDNLVRVLSKYDCEKWYYVGYNSESFEQNEKYSFDMAFGGGGFALSAPLAKVLARVLDSCLIRYPHLYGSDSRIFSCVAELGVHLTHEPGFHQVDVRGNLFGILAAHPLSPLLSLHHLDVVEPLFPGMTRIQAVDHLFQAVHADPARILEQTVCYDKSNLLTVSVAWGYAVQVFEGNQLLPDLLSLQRTFTPWKRGKNVSASYMLNTRVNPSDPCKKPDVFFLKKVLSSIDGVWTEYTRHSVGKCVRKNPTKKLVNIRVFSQKLDFDVEQLKAPRRPCCDISAPINETMIVGIRQCGHDELISMQT